MMNYRNEILKTASLKEPLDKAVKSLKNLDKKQKAKIGLTVGSSIGAVAGYNALSDKNKKRVKEGRNALSETIKSKSEQGLLSGLGAAAGTAIQLRKGNSLRKSVATGGLAGGAAGDIIGSAIIPTKALYKKYKQEGKKPTKSEVGKTLASNVLPSAAMWGAIGGVKKARNKYIAHNTRTVKKASNNIKGIKEMVSDIDKGMDKRFTEAYKKYSEEAVKKGKKPIDALTWVNSPENAHFGRMNKNETKKVMEAGTRASNSIIRGALNHKKPFAALSIASAIPAVINSPTMLAKRREKKETKE